MEQNWFETFFDGLALDLWRAAMTPEVTRREADFLVDQLCLEPGASVLDVPCGNGRHSVELASRGFRTTGVDISAGFLAEAREHAPGSEWVHADMRDLQWNSRFDAAFCWGNSFGYFDHEACCRFLEAVARSLRPGGRFALETGVAAESILVTFAPSRKMQFGDLEFHSSAHYDAVEGRLDITYTFVRGERREVKPIHQWVHSAAEIRRMLRAAGLDPHAAFGDIDGSGYKVGSPHLIVIAERV